MHSLSTTYSTPAGNTQGLNPSGMWNGWAPLESSPVLSRELVTAEERSRNKNIMLIFMNVYILTSAEDVEFLLPVDGLLVSKISITETPCWRGKASGRL